MNKITFKSEKKYYNIEKIGIKNNTVRLIDINDKRFEKIFFNLTLSRKMYIEIVEVETNNSFIRKIKNLSVFGEYIIITWEDHFYYLKKILNESINKKDGLKFRLFL